MNYQATSATWVTQEQGVVSVVVAEIGAAAAVVDGKMRSKLKVVEKESRGGLEFWLFECLGTVSAKHIPRQYLGYRST
jgi:hypothetical protein